MPGKFRPLLCGVLLLIAGNYSLDGKEVTPTEVNRVVRELWSQWKGGAELDIVGMEAHNLPSGSPAYFLVDLGPNGWVMVSADDVVRPILAFSFDAPYVKGKLWADAATYLFDGYKDQIHQAIQRNDLKRNPEWDRAVLPQLKSAEVDDAVAPFIEVTWDQGSGWNQFCPADEEGPGGHAYVGCVAVAMAQAMSVYAYPVQPKGKHSYQHELYGTISVDYDKAGPYAWSSMKDNGYDEFNAKLLYHCAVGVDMDFGPDGSGAYVRNAGSALRTYFGYSQSVSFYNRYDDDAQWKALLLSELKDGRPIVYRGNPETGAGHAWNIDGYGLGYFHMNFGWSGSSNGYYTLDMINPGSYEFNFSQGALVGISPPRSAPYDLAISNLQVVEEQDLGSFVGMVEVSDEDPDNTYAFTLKGSFNLLLDDYNPPSFFLRNDSLFTDKVFDFNVSNPAKNVEELTIIVEDTDGDTYEETFQFQILEAYYGPEGIWLSDTAVMEQKAVGTEVAVLHVEDSKTDNSYTYVLKGAWNEDLGDFEAAGFALNGNVLQTAEVFDWDESDTCHLRIELTDAYGNELVRTFTIQITQDPSGATTVGSFPSQDMAFYPNPSDGWVHFPNLAGERTVEVLEAASGRWVQARTIRNNRLDLGDLPAGMYILLVPGERGRVALKLLLE